MPADRLDEPRPRFTLKECAELLESLYGLCGDLQVLHGERDLNFKVEAYDGPRYVLKVHNPSDGLDVIEMRNGALSHIRAVDPELPVPEVIVTRNGALTTAASGPDGRTSQVQLLSFLGGRHAGRDELDADALYAWGQSVARLGRALRGYFHPAASYSIQWDVRRTNMIRDRLDLLEGDARARATAVVDRFERDVAPVLPGLRAQIVHNDMSRDNLLVDGTGGIVGITDFGDMTHTALVCDLAVAIADVLDGRPDSIGMAIPMIEGYCSLTPLESREAAVLGDLVAARAATSVVVTTWRRTRHPDAPPFAEGAAELLALFEGEGWDGVAARFARAAHPSPSQSGRRLRHQRRPLPYNRRRRNDLLAARRRVLGPLSLSYDDPLHLVRGEGVHLFDADGRRYLDAYNNVPVVGHCHPAVVAAIAAQAAELVTNTRYLHEASVELAERLVATAPSGLDRVLFVNSGSEANDVAWRIARHATGASGGVVTRFAYHGVTEATTDLSPEEWPAGSAPSHVSLVAPPPGGPSAPGVPPAADVAAAIGELERRGHDLAALFVDSGFTSDGILGPAGDWLAAAAAAAHERGGVFVADEVQVGYGRSGAGLWNIACSGVQPDLMTLGKPMGNGFPVAAVLGRAELVDPFMEETGYFSTFGGNTLACAAALAVLNVIEDNGLVGHVATVAGDLAARLGDVVARHDCASALRSVGLLYGLDVVAPGSGAGGTEGELTSEADAEYAEMVVNRLRHLGVLVGRTGPAGNTLKIRPPLVFGKGDGIGLAERLDEALELAAGRLPGFL